jgi:hypothetical protein
MNCGWMPSRDENASNQESQSSVSMMSKRSSDFSASSLGPLLRERLHRSCDTSFHRKLQRRGFWLSCPAEAAFNANLIR